MSFLLYFSAGVLLLLQWDQESDSESFLLDCCTEYCGLEEDSSLEVDCLLEEACRGFLLVRCHKKG